MANEPGASGVLADRAPEIAATIIEARTTLKTATATLKRFDALASSTQTLLDQDGRPMVADLRDAIKAAEASLVRIDALTASGGLCRTVSIDYSVPVWVNVDRPVKNDLPSVDAARGGLVFNVQPGYSLSAYGEGVGIW